jgi:hypothetical protein
MSNSKPIITMDGIVLDVDHYKKYADGPLLLKCFEVIDEAIDAVEEGTKIELHDDTYIGLIAAYWALTALFERHTGAVAKEVSDKRIDNLRARLFGGDPGATQLPASKPLEQPVILSEAHLEQVDDYTLASLALTDCDNSQVNLLGADHSLSPEDFRNTIVPMANAQTVLRLLCRRLRKDGIGASSCLPAGETLQ